MFQRDANINPAPIAENSSVIAPSTVAKTEPWITRSHVIPVHSNSQPQRNIVPQVQSVAGISQPAPQGQSFQFHIPNQTQYSQPAVPNHAVIGQTPMPIPYAMTPQFLHPMMVETSTGHLHLQPFISHDGQIGITPVTPCPPRLPTITTPAHAAVPYMGMPAWSNTYYPSMVPPETVQKPIAQSATLSHVLQQQSVPSKNATPVNTSLTTLNSANNKHVAMSSESVASQLVPATSQTVWQSNSSISDKVLDTDSSQKAMDNIITELSSSVSVPDNDCSTTICSDPLQQACALSSIQPLSKSSTHLQTPMSSASHLLKSPDSGFGEGHTDSIACPEHEVTR